MPFDAWELMALGAFAFFLFWPVVSAWRYALLWPAREGPAPADEAFPHATVLLSLRGADPSLVHCLRGLLDQDYPDYDISIVIDNPEDAAWEMVRSALADKGPTTNVSVAVLEERRETCSLKVSAQLQALARLGPTCEVVAMIDADVVPPRHWLRSLVLPLLQPGIGGTSGLRCFAPVGTNWGTLVRYFWNGFASCQQVALQIPWGGSLAFRVETLRRSGLLDHWAQSICEDTSCARILHNLGLRLHFVSAISTLNHETIDLKSCIGFMRRQLVCVRLHHPRWSTVALLGVGLPLALLSALVLLPLTCLAENWPFALALGGLLAVHGLGLLSALLYAEHHLRRQEPGAPTLPLSWRPVAALALTQLVSVACVVSAACVRRIVWRGITYELLGAGKLRLVEYRPYQPPSLVVKPDASLI